MLRPAAWRGIASDSKLAKRPLPCCSAGATQYRLCSRESEVLFICMCYCIATGSESSRGHTASTQLRAAAAAAAAVATAAVAQLASSASVTAASSNEPTQGVFSMQARPGALWIAARGEPLHDNSSRSSFCSAAAAWTAHTTRHDACNA